MTPSHAPGAGERITRSEPVIVDPGAIEAQLSELWKRACTGEPSVSRAALWNVIVVARGREALKARKGLVDEMTPALPARAIVLASTMTPPSRRSVEATVESNLVAHPEGGRLVYSEQITSIGPPGCEPHFGALVRGLGSPGSHGGLLVEPALVGPALARELLPLADRVVLDSSACFRPQQLFDLNGLTTRAQPVPVADLGWLRLGGLRSLFAGLFDPPVGGGPLAAATRWKFVTSRAARPRLCCWAWLGVRLGWRPLRVIPARRAEFAARWRATKNPSRPCRRSSPRTTVPAAGAASCR